MTARIRVPKQAKRGEVVEIRTLLEHDNESGWRRNDRGQDLSAQHRHELRLHLWRREEIVNADLRRGISRIHISRSSSAPTETGELVFRWEDESGTGVRRESAPGSRVTRHVTHRTTA